MSDNRRDKPMTVDDLFMIMGVFWLITFVFIFSDACRARTRYLDLRDRLERIEQQVRR